MDTAWKRIDARPAIARDASTKLVLLRHFG